MESLITDVVAFVVDIAKIAGALLLAAAVGRKFIYDPITWVNGVNSKFASISSDLVELKGLVGELAIMQMQDTEKTSKSESPWKLTDIGKSISEYLSAKVLSATSNPLSGSSSVQQVTGATGSLLNLPSAPDST